MKKLSFCLIVLISAAFFQEVLPQSKEADYRNKDSVVATIGNIEITSEEFIKGYEYGPAFYKRAKDSKKNFLEHLVKEKLLALEGYSKGLDTLKEVKGYSNAFTDDLATEELYKDEIQRKVTYIQTEIDTVAAQKIIDVEIQWLYTPDRGEIMKLQDSLNAGKNFQKLFERQLNDTIAVGDRSLKSSRYQLEMKNPALGKIVDTLKIGKYSLPIKTGDGWYIVLMKDFSKKLIVTETEQDKIKNEARQAVMKTKMDELSDKYVNELMLAENPTIKRKPLQILRSYIARYELPKEKYDQWEMEKKLNEAIKEYGSKESLDYSKIVFAELKDYDITLNDFIAWYRTRDQYVKFSKQSFSAFSRSLEQMVWRMIRDKVLSATAKLKGYYNRKIVLEQSKWWRDKILYAAVKNEMINSITIENKEVLSEDDKSQSQSEFIEEELTKKLFRKISELKKKYDIKINEKLLGNIKVSDEEDVKAIEFYTIKRGGLIPRTPYPTIDNYWARWQ